MTAARLRTAPIVLLDVDDLAEADLDADLAERLELDGRVFRRPDAAGAAEDAVSLAEDVLRAGAAAAAAHDLGPGAATLAD